MDINNKQTESNGSRTASAFGDTGKKGNIFLFLITLCKKTIIVQNFFTTKLTKDIIISDRDRAATFICALIFLGPDQCAD